MTADRLTPQREAEIAARAEAATEGPWWVEDDQASLTRWVVAEKGTIEFSFGYVGNSTKDDAEFAAHAREDVPALLAELAAVRAERDEARAALERADNDVIGANLSRWEEEQDNTRLRLALKSAQRGRREARARVAELEAGAVAEDPNDRRRRMYVDGKGDGWIDLSVDPATGERDLTGITNPWKVATADDVRDDTGSLREIGRCW